MGYFGKVVGADFDTSGPSWEMDELEPGRPIRVVTPEPMMHARLTKRMERIDSGLLRVARGEVEEEPQPATTPVPAVEIVAEADDPFGGLILVEGEPLSAREVPLVPPGVQWEILEQPTDILELDDPLAE